MIYLLHLGASSAQAQNVLKNCFIEQMQARRALNIAPPPPAGSIDSTQQKLQQVNQHWSDCVKGLPIPLDRVTHFSIKTLTGEVYDSTSLAGKVVVMNFWFMGCAPCRAEMPALNRLVQEYKGKKVIFLGFTPDPAATLQPIFFQKNRFDFAIVPAAQPLINALYFWAYPTTYIVDGKGIIREAWNGDDRLGLAPYHRAKAVIDSLLMVADK